GPSEVLGLEHDHVARGVLDQVVDVAPEHATPPLRPLPTPSHHQEVHGLLSNRVQDDLVDLVSNLDDRARVDTDVFSDLGEALQAANPVVHEAKPDRLRGQVPRDLDDVQETELPRARPCDAGPQLDESLVLELPQREEDPV